MVKRTFILAGTLAGLVVAFLLLAQPWYLNWGATRAERLAALPGDQIVSGPARQQTRGITIDAPLDRVWPWLAAVGQDRNGFYSFDLLENLVGCEMPAGRVPDAAMQSWKVGDRLWMYPPHRAGGIGFATLRNYVPGRALAFGTHVPGTSPDADSGSWTFALVSLDPSTTRLLVRGRITENRSLAGRVFDRLIFDPAHFVMERRMMIGLKQVSEGSSRYRWSNHAQVALWMLAFGLMATSAVMVFRREAWWRPLAAFAMMGAIFAVLTLAQPPVGFGALISATAAFMLLWAPPTHELLVKYKVPRGSVPPVSQEPKEEQEQVHEVQIESERAHHGI